MNRQPSSHSSATTITTHAVDVRFIKYIHEQKRTRGMLLVLRTCNGLTSRVPAPSRNLNKLAGSPSVSQSYGCRVQPVNTSRNVHPSMNTSDSHWRMVPGMPGVRGRNVSGARQATGANRVVYWLPAQRTSHRHLACSAFMDCEVICGTSTYLFDQKPRCPALH